MDDNDNDRTDYFTPYTCAQGNYCYSYFYTGKNPPLKQVYKELLPLANDWKGIGIFLGVLMSTIEQIKSENESSKDCLLQMLSELEKQDTPPTWDDIANAVKPFNKKKSTEIRRRIPK